MNAGQTLPKFGRPPLIEVVHGIQFRRLPVRIVDIGLFYERVKARYPQVQTLPPLPSIAEVFGADPARNPYAARFLQSDAFPRIWFVSSDQTMLIQLQTDRLLLNWRKGDGDSAYPNFDVVTGEFRRILYDLQEFANETGLGIIQPTQCELTYVNLLRPGGEETSLPTQVFRPWSAQMGPEWTLPLEDLSFNARYLLHRDGKPCGRLSAALSTIVRPPRPNRALQLDITAVGTPEPDTLDGVLSFHAMAHEHIVFCFTGITTDDAHKQWERLR